MEDGNHGSYAMQLASSSVLPMVLKAATDLGLLDIIARASPDSSLSPSQIASQLPTKNQNPPDVCLIDRILRCLASHSIVTCSVSVNHEDGRSHRLYGLAPVSMYFLKKQEGESLVPFLNLIQDKVMLDMWYHLKEAVLEGGLPFERAHGMSAVAYVGKDPRVHEVFQKSMKDFNFLFIEALLENYKGFDGLKSVVDVGGGDGSILNMIVSKYPTIKGTNFDQPTVIEASPSYLGIEHVAGDMFASIPDGDAIFMKWILHSWNDDHCVKLLKNCYDALPGNGKVIVVDLVIPETPEANLAVKSMLQLDLFMTSMNPPTGKERTTKEFESLAKAAGFSQIQVRFSAFCFSVVEFHKYI